MIPEPHCAAQILRLYQSAKATRIRCAFISFGLSMGLLLILLGRHALVHAVDPPTPTKIAFISDRDGNPEIYVMNAGQPD